MEMELEMEMQVESPTKQYRSRSPSFSLDDDEVDFSSSSASPSPSESGLSPSSSTRSFSQTTALSRLSLDDPPTPTLRDHGRLSVSTAATSADLSRSDSLLTDWSADEESGTDGEDESLGHARVASTSAPVRPLMIPAAMGRKRSLTDVFALEDDQAGKVANELSKWINASPSPFEHEFPRDPLPRPLPEFPAILSSTPAARPLLVFGLDERGLPAEPKPEGQSVPAKRSFGFIPGPLLKMESPKSTKSGQGVSPKKEDPNGAG